MGLLLIKQKKYFLAWGLIGAYATVCTNQSPELGKISSTCAEIFSFIIAKSRCNDQA